MIVSVCGSVYLSASISPELRIKSPPFLRLLKLAVTWSSWQACDTLCTCVCGWRHVWTQWQECTHTHTHRFNRPFSGTTRVSRYQNGKTNLDFTEARDSEWQWHLLGHMQDCTVLQTDNHASTPTTWVFYRPEPFLPPSQQRQGTEGIIDRSTWHKMLIHKVTQQVAAQIWHWGMYWNWLTVGQHRCGFGVLWYLQLPCYSCELMSVDVHCICSIGGVPSCTEVLPCVQIFWRCPGVYACFHFNTTVKCHIVL